MRPLFALLVVLIGLDAPASAQSCTGLCLQQVACPNGGTTTITGTVYAPNGVDPLPNVTVYIPNAPVDAFTAGVSCPVIGQPPPGSPLVGTMTGGDGTFKLENVPVGSNIPLVVQSGRWRRQVVVPGTAACADTAFSTRMPRIQSEGDIPKIAIATGSADSVECVLRKVGIDDTEFTNPLGSGRINIYLGGFSQGARVDATTPSGNALMGDLASLNQYDVLMLPCEGAHFTRSSAQLANLIQFANAGGRVYTSHFGYVWMYQNPPFSGVANWTAPPSLSLPNGIATVDTSFPDGQTLSQWLQLVGASTTQGQMPIFTVRQDLNGIIAPTQSWLTLNDPANGNPVMQFTFDTPVGATANQCGRVLFNEYHVEDPIISSPGKLFPTECSPGAMTPQEKLLEFSLFSLTGNGGAPTLTPTSKDFGTQPIGFSSAPQSFTWKNNSTFAALVSSTSVSGDFAVTSNTCASVTAGASCEIGVVFKPSALGARTGTLTVVSSGKTLTAALTGTGVPDLVSTTTSLDFGSLDVGASTSKTIAVTNNASGAVPVPALTTTGDYAATSNCGASLAASATCAIIIIFKPTATGPRPGTLTMGSGNPAYAGVALTLTGNGVDFSLAVNPSSGDVIAGYSKTTSVTTTPIAGFAAPVTLSCTTAAPASTCTPSLVSFVPSTAVMATVTITTRSKYTVIGIGGFGGNALLSLIAGGSFWLLWINRRRTRRLAKCGLVVFLLAATTFTISGCSGKEPDLNSSYTPADSYTYTLTATDGIITHTATYSLKVTVN